ncbi:TonB-dependent receptor [Permianibacter sp. IMCC34836]|uniref:TonB-dependent receptor n=1 Tax=Permianibacter fluminis TaxID=2738515 RepID=UPI0015570A2B|nr:TonB-dependent receptor [Permianibacter fluminis]NQD37865.1 TonB-dependent receptor [Permianibacter fluminis]
MQQKQNPNRLSVLTLAILSTMAAAPSFADDDADAAAAEKRDNSTEVLEVTARRVAERIQDVPVAVTAISEQKLGDMGAQTIADIERIVPNLTINASRATNSTITAYLRGVGQNDPLWGYEPGVGVYIDDVYMARPQGGVLDLLDIQRVEVLRGPQGTLYGKNTIGGAIKYITRELPDYTRGYVEAAVGAYNQRDVKFGFSTPVVDDKFYVGVSGAKLNRDGFGEVVGDSPYAGDDMSDKDITAGRINLTWKPTENLSVKLVADDIQDDSNARGGQRLTVSGSSAGYPTVYQPLDDRYDSRQNLDPDRTEVNTSGQALTITWDISDDWQFKSVTAKRKGDTLSDIDFDQLNRPTFDVLAVYEDEQKSQEFQLTHAGEKLDFVSGIYLFDGDACGAFLNVLAHAGISQETSGCVNTKSQSIYAQGSYKLSDRWSLTLGGRSDKDEKDADVRLRRFLGLDDSGTVLFDGGFSGDETFNEFSPHIGADFKINSDMMVYASYSHGFKSGGFNMRGNILVDPDAGKPFDPETVDTLELGLKGSWFDNRLTGYFALFTQDYQDKQVTVGTTVGITPVQRVLNAADATADGFELEMNAKLTDALSLNIVYGYLDAQYDKFIAAVTPGGVETDIADTAQFINAPEQQYSVGLSYDMDLSFGQLLLAADYAYRDDTYIFETPTAVDQKAYSLYNASAVLYLDESNWRIALHGRNLGDEAYRTGGYNFPGNTFDNTVTGFYGDPKTWTLSAQYSF